MNMKEVLRTNTYITGFIIALVAPVITLLMLIPIIRLIMQVTGNNHFVDNQGILLLGIIPNILFIRYFMVKVQDEKTAKGLTVITTILVILFFMFIHNHSFELPF
jgi:hypothetical protein